MTDTHDVHRDDAVWEEVLLPIEDDGQLRATQPDVEPAPDAAAAPVRRGRRPRAQASRRAVVGLGAVMLLGLGFTGGVLAAERSSGSGGSAGAATGPGGGQMPSGFPGGAMAGASGAAPGGMAGTTPSDQPGGASSMGDASSTVGEVANVKGGTLYVTTSDGTTVRVVAATGATVTRTATSSMTAVHPGDRVVISGSADDDGTVRASSVRATSSSAGG